MNENLHNVNQGKINKILMQCFKEFFAKQGLCIVPLHVERLGEAGHKKNPSVVSEGIIYGWVSKYGK